MISCFWGGIYAYKKWRNLRGQLFVLTIPGAWSLQYHWSRQVAPMKAEFRFQNLSIFHFHLYGRMGELHSLTPCPLTSAGFEEQWFPDPCSHTTVCLECVSIFIKCLVWILLTLVGQNHSPESLQKDLLFQTLWGCLGEMWLEWPFENVRGTRFISQKDI